MDTLLHAKSARPSPWLTPETCGNRPEIVSLKRDWNALNSNGRAQLPIETTRHCREKALPRRVAFREATDRQEWACSLKTGGRSGAEFAVLAGEVAGSGPSETMQFSMPSASAKSRSAPPAFKVSAALAATEFGSSPLDPGNEDDATSEPVLVCDVKFFQRDKRLCFNSFNSCHSISPPPNRSDLCPRACPDGPPDSHGCQQLSHCWNGRSLNVRDLDKE